MKKREMKSLGVLLAVSLSLLLPACSGDSAQALLTSAKAKLGASDSKAAVIQLKNALQKDPTLAEARYLLGKVLLDSGDIVGALVELGKAAELGYSQDELVPSMAQALLAQQAYSKLIDSYSGTKLQSPKAVAQLKVALGTALASTGNMGAAIEAAEAALAAVPNDETANLLLIRIWSSKGDATSARARLATVLEQHPDSSRALLMKAELLSREGAKKDEVVAALRAAIAKDERNTAAVVALVPLLMQSRDLGAAKVEIDRLKVIAPNTYFALYFSAWHALETGELEIANTLATQLLKSLSDKPDVLYLAGTIAARRNALTQAEDHLAKALSIEPRMDSARLLLAQTLLRRGDSAKALSTLKPMLEAESPDSKAIALAAEAFVMSGDVIRGEALFAKVAKLDPSNIGSRIALAGAKMAKGETEQGIKALREIAQSTKDGTADLLLVRELARLKRFDEASVAVDGLEAKATNKAMAKQVRATLELARGRTDAARLALESAVAADSHYFPAVAKLAELELREKKLDKARQRLEAFLKSERNHVGATMALLGVKAQGGASAVEMREALTKVTKSAPSEREPHIALIRLLLGGGEPKLALSAAQTAVGALPDDMELQQLLGQAQLAAGDSNQAISTFSKLIAGHAKLPQPYLLLADAQNKAKDTNAAIQTLRKGVAAVPQYMPTYQVLTAMEMAAGHQKEALAVARAAQSQSPGDGTGYMLEGDLALASKNLPEASAAYKRGLERTGVSGLAIRLHRAYLAQGKAAEANTLETQFMQKQPDNSSFLTYIADLAVTQRRYDVAEKHYKRMIELQPSNAVALNNLAWVLYKQNKAGALSFSQRANEVLPDRPEFLDTQAEIIGASGDLAKAIELQRRAVALAPDNHLHRLHLAKFLIAAGGGKEAKVELEKLAKLGNKFQAQDEVQKLLGAL